jgi:integrase
LGANSVIKIRGGLVAPALRWATLPGDDGQPPLRAAPSPFVGLELPEPDPFRAATLDSTQEIRLFVDIAYQVDPQWADVVLTALCTGFRFGEVAALGPGGLLPGTAEVIALRRFSAGRLLPGTKSGRGQFRSVPVPAPVMSMLTRRAAGKPVDALLFTTSAGGRWPFSSYWKRWDRLRDELERRGMARHLTGHGLRHSLISALHADNAGDGLIRKIAGHRDTRTNDHYHHLTAPGRAAITAVTATFLER